MYVTRRLPTFALGVFTIFAGLGGTAVAADWQAGAPAEWKQVLEAAKKEDPVVLAGQPELQKPLSEAFERDTGLKMDFIAGGYNELDARFQQGARAGKPTIDMYFAGGTAVMQAKDGILEPVNTMLMLPGVTDTKNWIGGFIKYEDNAKKHVIIPSEYVHGWPLFDANKIKPGTLTKWKDLLKPEFKGKIAAYDPTVPGPGQAVGMFLAASFGMDYVKALYQGQDVKLVRNPRQLVEWVARGTYPIALAALATHIEAFKKEGLTNLYVPQMEDAAGILLGGSALIEVAKNPPHPNAIKVFVNWYMSQPGQFVYSNVWKVPSRRLDVKVEGIPDYVVPKDGMKYNEQYTEEWYTTFRPKFAAEITKMIDR
jgi:ABC-type Fe3+ transport system substrate-binding protein